MALPNFEKFFALEGSEFLIELAAGPADNSESLIITLVLKSATLDNTYENKEGKCESFSLLFLGSSEQPIAQGNYPFENSDLGSLSLFIVPVAQSEKGVEYEAIIDHLIESD